MRGSALIDDSMKAIGGCSRIRSPSLAVKMRKGTLTECFQNSRDRWRKCRGKPLSLGRGGADKME